MNARFARALPLVLAGAMLSIAPAFLWAAEAQQSQDEEILRELSARRGDSLGPPGGEVRALVLAPTDPDRMYLGTATGHVYASADRGASWRPLPLELSHEAIVDNILVHPEDADVLFVAFWTSDGTGGLARSMDGGATWTDLPVPASPSLRAIAVAPSDLRIMYVGGIGGVWRSDDGGNNWRTINGSGLATDFIESLAVDPRDPEHVYAGTWRQVYRTRDGGERWQRIYQGMAIDRDIFSLTISPHDPEVVFAGTCNFLYRSDNSGGSWGERRSGLAVDHNRIHTIVHDPLDPQVLYAGTRGALYRSDDGGRQWSVLVSDISVSAVALDSRDGTLFIGTEERGVLIGRPGDTFVESNAGLTSARVVAFDALPGAPRVLFAARADGPLRNTIHYSTDIGRTWKPLGVTPSIGEIRFIRAQAEPVNRVIVVGDSGWWNVAPGGRWEPVPAPPGRLTGVEIAHEAGGRVLATTDQGLFLAEAEALVGTRGESRPFDADDSAIWRSVWQGGALGALAVGGGDFLAVGQEWAIAGSVESAATGSGIDAVPTAGFGATVQGVALDPSNHRVAYGITLRDVYRTLDGGATWELLPLPWPAAELRAIAVDPNDPDQVLALDYRGAVYRGHGDGQHWLVLDDDRGLYRAWSLRVSRHAPGYALVATQGHGLRVISTDPLRIPPAAGSRE